MLASGQWRIIRYDNDGIHVWLEDLR